MKKIFAAALVFSASALAPALQPAADAAPVGFSDAFNSLSFTAANWAPVLPNWEVVGLQGDGETYAGIHGLADASTGLAAALATGAGVQSTGNLEMKAEFAVHQQDGGGIFFAVDTNPDNVYIAGISLSNNLLYARTLSNSASLVAPVSGLSYDTPYKITMLANGGLMNLFLHDQGGNLLASIPNAAIATLDGNVGIYAMTDATFTSFSAGPAAVPVPSALLLAGSGLASLLGLRSRKGNAA